MITKNSLSSKRWSKQARNRRNPKYLEVLEQRALFNVIPLSWGGGNGNWSDDTKWGSDTHPFNHGGNQYIAKFQNVGAVTVHVTQDDTLSGIQLIGDSQVTLVFDTSGSRTLAVNHVNGVSAADGIVKFDQVTGDTTSLTVQLGTATNGNLGIDGINITGNTGGQSALTVKHDTLVAISYDLFNGEDKFDMTIDAGGSLTAANVWLMGKGLGSNDISTVNVSGYLSASQWICVGGTGKTNFTASGTSSSVSGADLVIPSPSTFDAASGATVNISDAVRIGNTAEYNISGIWSGHTGYDSGSLTISNTLLSASGGSFTVESGAHVTASADDGLFTVYGANAATLTVRTGGTLEVYDLVSSGSELNIENSAPQLSVTGSGSYLHALGSIEVGSRLWQPLGNGSMLDVADYGRVKVDDTTTVYASQNEGNQHYFISLHSGYSKALETGGLEIDNGGTMIVYGIGTTAVVHGDFTVGPGGQQRVGGIDTRIRSILFIGPLSSVYSDQKAEKLKWGQYEGSGKLVAAGSLVEFPDYVLQIQGIAADMQPGDFFAGIDRNGIPVANSSVNYSDPLGTFTIDGMLDAASYGMTLDIALGSASGYSSTLAVTGEADWAGDLFSYDSNGLMTLGQLYVKPVGSMPAVNSAFTILTVGTTGSFGSGFVGTGNGFTDYPWIYKDLATNNLYTRAFPGTAIGLDDNSYWSLSLQWVTTGSVSHYQNVQLIRESPATATLAYSVGDYAPAYEYSSEYDATHKLVTFTYTFDPLFTDHLYLDRALNNGSNFAQLQEITLPINASSGTLTIPVPLDYTTNFRLRQNNLDASVLNSSTSSVTLSLPSNSSDFHYSVSYDSSGWPLFTWDGNYTSSDTILWSVTKSTSPDDGEWGNWGTPLGVDSYNNFTAWLATAGSAKVLVWYANSPDDVHAYTVTSTNPAFDGTLSGSINTANGNITVSGWNTTTYAGADVFLARSFDPYYEEWITDGGANSGASSSLTFSGVGPGYYAVWAYNDSTGLTSRLSNFIDLSAPAAPSTAYLINTASANGTEVLNVLWNDNSNNESYFQIQRGLMPDSDPNNTAWTTIGTSNSTTFADAYNLHTYTGYGIQYRVRSAHVLADSTFVYSDYTTTDAIVMPHFSAPGPITLTDSFGMLTATNGTVTISSADFAGRAFTIDTGSTTGTMTLNGSFDTAYAGLITLTGTGTTTLLGSYGTLGALTIASGKIILGEDAGVLKVSSLTLASGACLDLQSNTLIVQATDSSNKASLITALDSALASGSNGGLWNGNGLTSGIAALDHTHYGVGLFDNSILGLSTIGGLPVDSNSIVLATAHYGDANNDGIVDIMDLSLVTNHWQTAQYSWTGGDLNNDGFVEIRDLSTVQNNWQATTSFSLAVAYLNHYAIYLWGISGWDTDTIYMDWNTPYNAWRGATPLDNGNWARAMAEWGDGGHFYLYALNSTRTTVLCTVEYELSQNSSGFVVGNIISTTGDTSAFGASLPAGSDFQF